MFPTDAFPFTIIDPGRELIISAEDSINKVKAIHTNISEKYDWNTMFLFCGAVMALGSIICLFMDAEEKVVARDSMIEEV